MINISRCWRTVSIYIASELMTADGLKSIWDSTPSSLCWQNVRRNTNYGLAVMKSIAPHEQTVPNVTHDITQVDGTINRRRNPSSMHRHHLYYVLCLLSKLYGYLCHAKVSVVIWKLWSFKNCFLLLCYWELNRENYQDYEVTRRRRVNYYGVHVCTVTCDTQCIIAVRDSMRT